MWCLLKTSLALFLHLSYNLNILGLILVWNFLSMHSWLGIVITCSDGSGSKIFDPGRVNFLWLGLGRSGQPSMVWVWVWKISPKNIKFFNFFTFGSKKSLRVGSESTRVKGGLASYLLQVKSKLGPGQGPSLISWQPWVKRWRRWQSLSPRHSDTQLHTMTN